jgi:DNA ligase-4
MSSRTKRAKSPDVDAIEEDEKQYGSGPLTLEELDEQ